MIEPVEELSSKNFSARELRCKCDKCNREVPHNIHPNALEKLQAMREYLGRALILTSAYRCKDHPEEAKKATPGQHNKGTAFDIRVSNGVERMQIIEAALFLGASGIGVANTFIHVDWRKDLDASEMKVVWKY